MSSKDIPFIIVAYVLRIVAYVSKNVVFRIKLVVFGPWPYTCLTKGSQKNYILMFNGSQLSVDINLYTSQRSIIIKELIAKFLNFMTKQYYWNSSSNSKRLVIVVVAVVLVEKGVVVLVVVVIIVVVLVERRVKVVDTVKSIACTIGVRWLAFNKLQRFLLELYTFQWKSIELWTKWNIVIYLFSFIILLTNNIVIYFSSLLMHDYLGCAS